VTHEKPCQILVLTITAVVLALPAYSQDAPKKRRAPQAGVSPSQSLLIAERVGRKLTAMAEDFPRTNTISSPPRRNAASPTMSHAAGANYFSRTPPPERRRPQRGSQARGLQEQGSHRRLVKHRSRTALRPLGKRRQGLSDLLVDRSPISKCECRTWHGAARTFRRTLWPVSWVLQDRRDGATRSRPKK